MSNFSLLGCLELLILFLTLFRVRGGDPNFFLHISFNWVEIRLHTKFQLPVLLRSAVVGLNHISLHVSLSWVKIRLHTEFHLSMLLRSGSFMVGDKNNKGKSFSEINSFLSPSSS